ncbi:deoxyguanosinetriphosphate triphosphohydrolase [Sulfurihydrogenibium azorense]|uniref:deoxyguanosinetriphosphate triphosphohydrolase n=1 Tax=Sulfurihydrogenibium azorense TaxID=309806 RepID=UPI002409BA78|nr:deoxyguanosinetriphosphate triphosphohydrolase [Sulfurihydrogenibium azorense]MDM7273885.1 deoxyguanosinetriphosphate triphosphohydrolase [Sulfurihydrogenibium azorense]
MNIRQSLEEFEIKYLHPSAAKSLYASRDVEEPECSVRTKFQRDRDRILHSKAFRRLKHKTQVFLSPEGDHYRTRLTHTLEVSQISRTIARALRLNEDLVEAICYGHDLGHTPFGHAGEFILKESGSYHHAKHSLRVVEKLENEGKGLNLTKETRDGILKHSKGKSPLITEGNMPKTLEGQIVRIADKIAYINHDLEDAIRAGLIKESDIPEDVVKILGNTKSKRISTLVMSVINSTVENDYRYIVMDEKIYNAMYKLRDFLYEKVYFADPVKRELDKAKGILQALFEYYEKHYYEIPFYEKYLNLWGSYDPKQAAVDYIAGMTDRYAIKTYEKIFIPKSWYVV